VQRFSAPGSLYPATGPAVRQAAADDRCLRILVLAPQPFFIQRGTPLAVRMLLHSLGRAGHRCDAVVHPGGEDVELPNVRVHRVPALPGLSDMPPGFTLKKLVADALMFPMVAWRLMRRRYDMVIAVEEAAFMALALKPVFGVPYIYDIDSSMPEQIRDRFRLPGWLDRLLVACERMAVRGSIGAIPCCKALGEMVQEYDSDLPVQTLEDVTLVEPATPAPPPADCRFDEPVVMYVGNLEGYQGVGLLIEGFARALASGTRARLVVIGGTPDTIAEHRVLARDAGVEGRVTFTGPRPVKDLGRYMRQATIVASPRLQGRNTPMKVYSYLDSGRPLVATRLRTHTQVLDDSIAMLVEPTPEGMGRGIAALIADPALRDRLARAAGRRVQAEFSPRAYRRKLLGFLEDRIIPRLDLDRGGGLSRIRFRKGALSLD
jgi:glycosyltransferase involved in cell wall biosynthesis